MTLDEYQELAARTRNDGAGLTNAALGLAGEAGEVADMVKKITFHGHAFDTASLVDELGDALWYVAEMASVLGVGLDMVAQANIAKLRRRYPEGFSPERSRERET
jgi:NTP pyrophosphatase (non-canonical NTP hydrolase)